MSFTTEEITDLSNKNKKVSVHEEIFSDLPENWQNENLFKKNDLIKIENLFERNKNLKKVYFFKKSLISLWSLKFQTYECFMVELNKWCEQAETSGLKALEAFALDLKKIKIVH